MLSDALTKKKLIEERKAAKKAAYEAEKEVKKKVFKNKLSKFMSIVCESNNILSSISGEILSFASKGKMIFSNGENADDCFFDFANLYWRDERVSKGPIKNWLGFEMKEEFARQGLGIIGEPVIDEVCIEHPTARTCQNTYPVGKYCTEGSHSCVPCGSSILHISDPTYNVSDIGQSSLSPPTSNWKLYIGDIVSQEPMSYFSERFEITDYIPPEFKKRSEIDNWRMNDWYQTVYCKGRTYYECEAKGGCGRLTGARKWVYEDEDLGTGYYLYRFGCMSKKIKRMVLDWSLPKEKEGTPIFSEDGTIKYRI